MITKCYNSNAHDFTDGFDFNIGHYVNIVK